MQSVILSTVAITPIINSISSLSTNIFGLVSHIRVTKNIHYDETIKVLNKTDIEATIMLLQSIILDISEKEHFSNNKFIIIALQHVKDCIASIETELNEIKERIAYNSSLYLMSSMRSYDLLPNLNAIELKSAVLDKRCDYLFRAIPLAVGGVINDPK
jgi:hypothetical protein